MDVSSLDFQALSRALEDHDPDRETYLDLETGSLWTFVFSDSTDETRKRRDDILAEGTRYRRVPSMTPQEAYEEREDFVETVTNTETQDELFRALERKGALRNFREVLIKHAEERLQWSNHRRERTRRRLEAFLESLGLPASEIPLENIR